MSGLILYASPLSSYSAKVRIVLCAKGIDFEERLPPGGYRSAQYRAIVPMGTLPALQEGDWVLSESEAINEYLEERYPHPPMMPTDPRLRAEVRFLNRFHDLYLEPRVRALFPHARGPARDAVKVGELHADITLRLEQLASRVRPQPFLLSPELSLADCGPLVTLPLASWILAACGQPLFLPPVLANWLERASDHPAVEQALYAWRQATRDWLAS
jgi:glutathione S-transferase